MTGVQAPFGRVLTAMVTPMTAGGEVDLDATQRVAKYLVDAGNDGLVISGTTGESPTTSDQEKEQLLRAVREAVGDGVHIVAGAGTYDTAHSIELAQQAEKAGANGLLLVTPYYSKPPQSGLVEHFSRIADATGLPVMLYDIPGRSGVPIDTETLLRLAEHDRIVAVKDAKGELFKTATVLARSDLAVYSGEDALNLPLLALGAVGMVSVVIPAVHGIMNRTQGAIMAKATAQLLGVIPTRTVRLPLVEATDEQVNLLREDLAAAGL